MKRVLPILLVFGLFFAAPVFSHAQKPSKEEKKKLKAEIKLWKKKAKSYTKDPIQLRDDLENYTKQIKELSAKNKDLMKRISSCNSAQDSLQAMTNKKISELAAMSTKYEQLQTAYEGQKNITEKDIHPGLVYKVQIGAFVYFDITQYLKDTENFEGENAGGMNKYTIGNFKEMEIAESFTKDIQKMGIPDAWIVPYIDGKRVTLEEARQFLANQ